MINLKEYQDKVEDTWLETENEIDRIICGLSEEVGEIAGKFKRYFRYDYSFTQLKEKVKEEIGDTFYYLAKLCNYFDFDIEQILQENLDKLRKRKEKGTLRGEGDMI